jgi:hypothetical protein
MDLILGPFSQKFPAPTCFQWSETEDNWIQPDIYFEPMKAYFINTPQTTIDITGEANDDTISINLTNHNKKNDFNLDGWNLIGNPYPAPIDWDAKGWMKDNIINSLYLFNNTTKQTGYYTSYVSGISNNGAIANIIPVMQGFWVKAIKDGEISIANSTRKNIVQTFPNLYKSLNENRPLIRLAAYSKNKLIDYTVIYFDTNATNNFDYQNDALKIMNNEYLIPNIFTKDNNNIYYSINALPYKFLLNDSDIVVPLMFNSKIDGDYTISLSTINNFPQNYNLNIEDTKTKNLTNLKVNPNYNFSYNQKDNTERFYIHFTPKKLNVQNLLNEKENILIYINNNNLYVDIINNKENIKSQIFIYDITGKLILEPILVKNSHNIINISNLSEGIYMLKYISKDTIINQKFIITK